MSEHQKSTREELQKTVEEETYRLGVMVSQVLNAEDWSQESSSPEGSLFVRIPKDALDIHRHRSEALSALEHQSEEAEKLIRELDRIRREKPRHVLDYAISRIQEWMFIHASTLACRRTKQETTARIRDNPFRRGKGLFDVLFNELDQTPYRKETAARDDET